MDISKYKDLYLQETREHLEGIEKGLISLERDPLDRANIDELFRHYHSIKGMSAAMGYEPVMRLAHAEENVLDALRSGKMSASGAIASALFRCLDALRSLVDSVERGEPLKEAAVEIAALKAAVEAPAPAPAQAATARPAAETPAAQETGPAHELKLSSTMKVEGAVFDGLMEEVGDLFMAVSAFRGLSDVARSIAFKDGLHMLETAVTRLYRDILAARMLPVGHLVAGMPRIVRDASVRTGKTIELATEGMEASLDKTVLENLASPLVHIVRNSVDHGIETPAEREALGKPSAGRVTIRAYSRRDMVAIEVADDGKGIDVARVKAAAINRGFDRAKVEAMGDKEAMMLICAPGLSTASAVTDTSGRGVGMDAVKHAIEALGGSLSIESEPGKGSRITMELPKTTAIVRGLTVRVADEVFMLPVSRVARVEDVAVSELVEGTYWHEGARIPVVELKGVMKVPGGAERERSTIVVVEGGPAGEGGKRLAGIKVDDFVDEIDAYVRPLTPPLSNVWGVSGVMVMGDGRPVFLLDIPQILERASSGAAR